MKALVFLSLMVLSTWSFSQPATNETPPPKPPVVAPSPAKSVEGGEKGAQSVKGRLEELFAVSHKVNAPGNESTRARGEIDSAMDWELIAEKCLGSANWKKLPSAKRAEFRNLLREVVEKTAYGRLDKFWEGGTTYSFEKVDVNGNNAHVVAKFMSKGKPFRLEYFLNHKSGKWLIHDIEFERVRYSENINEQIEAFLREKSFNDLLGQLRKRRDELVAESKKSR
jgi:ABC-type transporter MlaC component